MTRVAGLILAGGRATRMGGGHKPLLPLGSHTIIDEILARLRGQVDRISISTNDAAPYSRFNLPLLADDLVDAGPLAGLLRGLEWAAGHGAETLLSVPGDTPFIPLNLATQLTPAPSCAETAGIRHHLTGLWPVHAAPELRRWLDAEKSRSVAAFAQHLGVRYVDMPAEGFVNINMSGDLARARNFAGASCTIPGRVT